MTNQNPMPINTAKDKITALLQEAYSLRINDLGKSIDMSTEALKLAEPLKDKTLCASAFNRLSLYYMIQGSYKESRENAEKAINCYTQTGDEIGIAEAKYSLGSIYYKTNNYHLGLVNLMESLKTFQKYRDYHNMARTYKSLGTIYEYFGDVKNAKASYKLSISCARKVKDPNLETNVYNPLSGLLLEKGKTEEAMEMVQKAIDIKLKTGDIRGLAFAIYGRGKVYVVLREYAKAEADYKEAIAIHERMGEKLGLAMALHKLGQLYKFMGNLTLAKDNLKKAIGFAETYQITFIVFKSYYLLYQIAKLERKPQLSLKYLESYIQQKESVINTQTLKIIENYELIKKVEDLEREQKSKKQREQLIRKKNIAEQSAKVRQEFLSIMSHEIRTPLNAVITITSLLKPVKDSEEKSLIDTLRFSANNLLLIVNDILDFNKLDTDKAKLELNNISLKDFIAKISKTYESIAGQKNLSFRNELLFADNLYIKADETKLAQILSNLLSNAIKFTDEGEISLKINIESETKTNITLHFEIADTGIGIEKKHQKLIFQVFKQVSGDLNRRHGGSGLGLAIVKKLLKLHKSKLELKSEPGQGSVFNFAVKFEKASEIRHSSNQTEKSLKGMHVLIAEDNPINAMVAEKILNNWGITCELAENGKLALQKALITPYDLIFMDIHMPEMNGIEAALAIRSSDNLNRQKPIFALTADITADLNISNSGVFNGVLHKPIEIDKLKNSLMEL